MVLLCCVIEFSVRVCSIGNERGTALLCELRHSLFWLSIDIHICSRIANTYPELWAIKLWKHHHKRIFCSFAHFNPLSPNKWHSFFARDSNVYISSFRTFSLAGFCFSFAKARIRRSKHVFSFVCVGAFEKWIISWNWHHTIHHITRRIKWACKYLIRPNKAYTHARARRRRQMQT